MYVRIMFNQKYILLFIFLFLFLSCEDTASSLTGAEGVEEIDHVLFSNIETSVAQNNLEANGIIKNESQTITITPPWYIESQFYYQDTQGNTFLIGGESVRINNSLAPGISLEWTLLYDTSSSDDYQNFTINDLRAYKN